MHTRISKAVESPIIAAALALESRRGEQGGDQAVFVACDLAVLRGGIIEKVREHVKGRLPDLDVTKLIFSATHTHSAPVTVEGAYEIPKDGVMQPTEYFEFLLGRLSDVIVQAWQARKPGRVGWGLGHAVVAQNRRAVYADGHAEMYGKTNRPDFRSIEGYEDHGIHGLFFWDRDQKAPGDGGQRGLHRPGSGEQSGRQRRLLARRAQAAASPARRRPGGARLDRRRGRPVAAPAVAQGRGRADAETARADADGRDRPADRPRLGGCLRSRPEGPARRGGLRASGPDDRVADARGDGPGI